LYKSNPEKYGHFTFAHFPLKSPHFFFKTGGFPAGKARWEQQSTTTAAGRTLVEGLHAQHATTTTNHIEA
jgi:hypothetical protein